MNKKLVAAALGLAFAAPVFADSSNVTLYGRVHQALDLQSQDDNGSEKGGNFTLEDVSSRFGIRGQEDLGGGLSLIFGYEFSVAADANSGVGGRHSYIGMKGAYGTFVAGKQDGGNETVAPLYSQASLTGGVSNQGGPLTSIGGGSGFFSDTVAIDRVQRLDNSFGYKNTIGGVQIEARHALTGDNNRFNNDIDANGEAAVGDIKENGTRQTEIAATYKLGALTLGGGFQAFDQQGIDPATSASPERLIQGVAAYNFGGFTLAGLIAQTSLYGTNTANGEDSNTEYLLSATVPLTANSGIFGMYADSERNNLIGEAAEVSQAQIAYYYDFSKRTRSYIGYNRAENEIVAGPDSGETFEQDNLTIGLRHNF